MIIYTIKKKSGAERREEDLRERKGKMGKDRAELSSPGTKERDVAMATRGKHRFELGDFNRQIKGRSK